jgi:hypothetical protein
MGIRWTPALGKDLEIDPPVSRKTLSWLPARVKRSKKGSLNERQLLRRLGSRISTAPSGATL